MAARSALADFTRRVEQQHGLSLPGYHELWRWSVEQPERFWAAVWSFYDINHTPAPETVLTTRTMP